MTNPYVPLMFLAACGVGFAVVSVLGLSFVGPKRYNRAKVDAYECGIEPTPLTAMLFIIFDIESVFLYPFAVAFSKLGLFALVEMVLFIVTVFVAYAYVWRRGGLEWD
jgi:NADH-quinone oxidoreductase subunit A